MDDSEIATRLLRYLANAFDCPDLGYAEAPARISGGRDAAIFGFALRGAPDAIFGPLILRLNRARVGEERVRLETIVHNWLAAQHYACPDVRATGTDPSLLGGVFTVMTRLPGRPLAHEIERIGGAEGLIARATGLLRAWTILAGVIDAWVDTQIRLHSLAPAPLLAAVGTGGLDPATITFEGQLRGIISTVEQFSLAGLKPAVDWLTAHRPSAALPAVICHGDFHPLNILAQDGKVTGVIDWVNIVVAPAEMDVGSAIANIATAPFQVPRALQFALRFVMARILRRYQRTYARRRALDGDAVKYFQVFRCVHQLAAVLRSRAAGGQQSGTFDSAAGVGNLVRHIRAISGVTVDVGSSKPSKRTSS
jgi:aminoglycoside phosphotransferase (APT) family kinase protein